MKIYLRTFCLIVLMALPSCTGGLQKLGLSVSPNEFYSNLANEYKNLALYEENFMEHKDDALYFKSKARNALKGKNVEPDALGSREIPEFAVKELTTARSMLMDALETLRMDSNEALLAMAQSRYDCWLAMAEDFPVEEAYISCKAEFYNALALLNIPESDIMLQSIYFESGAIALHKKARGLVEKIAMRYRDRPHWKFILKGYTDSKGDKHQNKILSMRRAIAVKNTLGQYGVDLGHITIDAEGEVRADGDEAENSNSRRVEIIVRPDYVFPNKKRLTVMPGWQHLGGGV